MRRLIATSSQIKVVDTVLNEESETNLGISQLIGSDNCRSDAIEYFLVMIREPRVDWITCRLWLILFTHQLFRESSVKDIGEKLK